MKPGLRSFHQVFLLAILQSQITHAQLAWASNGISVGQTNGGGDWLGSNLWWSGSANQNWVSDSIAIFGGPNTAGAAVTLPSATAVVPRSFNTVTGTSATRLLVDVKVTQN